MSGRQVVPSHAPTATDATGACQSVSASQMADWISGDSRCTQSPSPLWLPSGHSIPENWKITCPSGPVSRKATPCSVVGQVSSGASASMLTFCQLACATQLTEGPAPVDDSDQPPAAFWNT